MKRVLIVHASKNGQSKKIADYMAANFRQEGHHVTLFDVLSGGPEPMVETYDTVVVGGPVYLGRFPRKLKKWVSAQAEELDQVPSYFFSVCLGILQKDEMVRREERRIVERFLLATEWTPTGWTIFAGGIPYSKYNWFVRRIMRRISAKAGVETNFKQDYEFTDWNEVRQFAGRII